MSRKEEAAAVPAGMPPRNSQPGSAAASHQPSVLRGILLMCAGVSLFPFMNAAVKLLGARYPATEIVWARFTGHLVVMLLVFLPQYGLRLFATRRPAAQIGRGLLMLVGNALFVVAIAQVPLATASAIGFTAPLIVTALAGPLLREHIGIRRWSAVLIGFAGALAVIRPGSGFHDPMLLLLLLGSATHALYLIATRWVGNYDGPSTSIVFSALMGSLIMTLVLPFSFVLPRDPFDIAMLCSFGLIGAAGHYLVIRAFRHGSAAVIAPLGYVELIGTATLGYLIFGNFPDFWTWIGAAVIIASGVYIALRERRRR
jgi:drug/metabolite transporter (DMT)-like permease